MVSDCFRYLSEYRGVTGTPGESNGPTWAIGEREGSPQGVATPMGSPNWTRGGGAVIRPFCIMLLHRYLLQYGLLLHIMSQYLCLFSLILQGLHEEGECRQLEFWAGKGANIRDLFCTLQKS